MKNFLEFTARQMVNHPDRLQVTEYSDGDSITFRVNVAHSDKGFLIGRGGKNIEAMRVLFNAIAFKQHKQVRIIVPD